MSEHELFFYGKTHGYWLNWGEFGRRSQHDKDLVTDMAYKDKLGKTLTDVVQDNIEWLKEFQETIRIKDDEVYEMIKGIVKYKKTPVIASPENKDKSGITAFIKDLKLKVYKSKL